MRKTFKFRKLNYSRIAFLCMFVGFSLFFFFSAQIKTLAQDLGFGPALIETANCIIGSSPCEPDTAQEIHLFQPGPNSTSALASTGALIDTFYLNPPNSSVVWAYDQYQKIQNRELMAVYAQANDPGANAFYFPGLGYTLLLPVLGLWTWSRNMVLIFYVAIVIVLSFLILFRQSLGGQASVTIINSIPSLILSLVLVTLSYPIAGFFVDLIYIGTGVVQNSLLTAQGAPGKEFMTSRLLKIEGQTNNDINYLQPDDPYVSIWAIWGTSNAKIFDCPGDENCVNNLIPQGIDIEQTGLLKYIGKILPLGEEAAGGGVVQEAGNRLLDLVLGLAAFMAAFRLFLALLKNYVTLALSPIYLPWLFFAAAIPSKTKSSIIGALKPLAAASLTFIAVYALFLLMIIIGQSDGFSNEALRNAGEFKFTPPLLGYSPDQVGEVGTSVTRALIIYVLFLAAPTIPDMINNLLSVQSSSQLAGQIGGTTSKAAGQVFGGFGKILGGKKK